MSIMVSLTNNGDGDGDLERIDDRLLYFGMVGLPVWWGLG